jgi:hypothetical protein
MSVLVHIRHTVFSVIYNDVSTAGVVQRQMWCGRVGMILSKEQVQSGYRVMYASHTVPSSKRDAILLIAFRNKISPK